MQQVTAIVMIASFALGLLSLPIALIVVLKRACLQREGGLGHTLRPIKWPIVFLLIAGSLFTIRGLGPTFTKSNEYSAKIPITFDLDQLDGQQRGMLLNTFTRRLRIAIEEKFKNQEQRTQHLTLGVKVIISVTRPREVFLIVEIPYESPWPEGLEVFNFCVTWLQSELPSMKKAYDLSRE